VLGRIGIGFVDGPVLSNGVDIATSGGKTTTNAVVKTNSHGLPAFDLQEALQFKFETRVPIGSTGFLSLGGTYYKMTANGAPDPWSTYVAYTISLEQLFNGITSIGKGIIPNFGTTSGP
jgi:hypothetical protein